MVQRIEKTKSILSKKARRNVIQTYKTLIFVDPLIHNKNLQTQKHSTIVDTTMKLSESSLRYYRKEKILLKCICSLVKYGGGNVRKWSEVLI
jgi:hypothetical protein